MSKGKSPEHSGSGFWRVFFRDSTHNKFISWRRALLCFEYYNIHKFRWHSAYFFVRIRSSGRAHRGRVQDLCGYRTNGVCVSVCLPHHNHNDIRFRWQSHDNDSLRITDALTTLSSRTHRSDRTRPAATTAKMCSPRYACIVPEIS